MHTYQIAEHSWLAPDGTLLDADCYSGAFPLGFNNPQMVAVKDIGPLPPGFYTLGEMQAHHPVLGPNVIPLIPDAQNVMHNRGGFFVHGKPLPPADIRSGSDGCICAQESTRLAVNSSPDRRLQVV
jgi:hypothetical protein